MRALLLLGILCAALVLPALADNVKSFDYYHPLTHTDEEVRKSIFEGMTPEEKEEWMKNYQQHQSQADKPC